VHLVDAELPTRSPNQVVAAIAARQHGVITYAQLLRAGLGRGAIAWRVREGWLHRIHRGVYAVGRAALTAEGRWLAAVLACGDGAVLSHRSAAALWGLRPSRAGVVDVTVPGDVARGRAGIAVHRPAPPTEATVERGIPVTTPARTLLDLAGAVDVTGLRRAVERAEELRIFDLRAVDAVISAHPGRRGRGALLAAVDHARDMRLTRSELERRFLRLCDDHALPRPLVNAQVEGLEVDFHWPDARLVVETDGREHHGTAMAFERDRERDERLVAAGWTVLRFTHRRLVRDPGGVARTVRAVLARRA
jgi:very-short-patch-repair endonuclease